MNKSRAVLRWSAAVPLTLATTALLASTALPSWAACNRVGNTTTCTNATPNPVTTTQGTGPGDNGQTFNMLTGSAISVTNRSAISLGDNASITLNTGSQASGVTNSGNGNYGTGPNIIEFNSNGTLIVQQGASVTQTGSSNTSEAVNVHGFGNRIENRGTISGSGSAAIWFEDVNIPSGAAKNVVDNFGIIRRVGGGAVIGTSGGSGIEFRNQSLARVEGNLSFASGNDDLFFFANSVVTGSINGGAGTDNLTLEGALGTSDSLAGSIAGFETLTKAGLGRWTITGSLSGFDSTTVEAGTLALTGNNAGYTAGVTINPLGTLEARAQSLPTESNPASNLNNIRNNGTLRFAQTDNGAYVGQIVGTGQVIKTGAGVVTLAPSAGANAYAGGTNINEGTIAVATDGALGAPTGGLRFNGGTLRSTASFSLARATTVAAGGGTFETAAGTLTHNGTVTGPGTLTKTGAGTLVLSGANSHSATQINGGVLQVGNDGNLGIAGGPLGFNGGTLRTTATFGTARTTTLEAGGGTVETQTGAITHSGAIGGAGQLTKSGTGTLVLQGTNAYAGGTRINAGVVEIAQDANLGAAGGPLVLETGTLRTTASVSTSRATSLLAAEGTFETSAATTLTHGGAISGPGGMTKAGTGTMVLTGNASHTGGTTIAAGTLQIGNGGGTGSIAGSIENDAALVFNRGNTLNLAGPISGSGSVTQAGSGATRLSGDNSYLGPTDVTAGALYINGDQTAAAGLTTANAGTTLGGIGIIGGDVTIADGATLSPGDAGTGPGTLGIRGSLDLAPGALLDYAFGQADVPGGPLNDLTTVGGNLTLDGTLNVGVPPGGSFDPGVYRVFTYGGILTDNGLAIGTIPAPDFFVQTSVAQQVNLVNTTGLTLNFWDGDAGPKNSGTVDGGNGTWQSSAGNDNWTNAAGTVNAPYTDGAFAIFSGTAGTVGVDNSLGAVTASGMQFTTDGYLIEGEPITLVGPDSILRVGDGTAAGAGMTATIAAELTGAATLRKTDLGTLVLEAGNSYTGGTAIDGGTLEVAADGALGAAAGGLGFNGGTLRTTASFTTARATTLEAGGGTFETLGSDLTHAAVIGGDGALTKSGDGTLTLTGANTYAGGTQIDGGTVSIADDANLGDAAGTLGLDGGTLAVTADVAMDRDTTLGAGGGTLEIADALELAQAGDIAGSGALTKAGTGTLVLTGAASHGGGTTIAAGALQLGDGGTTGSLGGDIANQGLLVLDRSNDFTLAGAISGSGALLQQGAGTTTLTGTSSYGGGTAITAGALSVSADANLGAASGPLSIDGGTLTSTASFTTARATTLEAGGGTFDTATGTLTHAGVIAGDGALGKTGAGTLVLGGANTYAGGTAIDDGVVQVSSDANLGDAAGPLSFDGGILASTASIAMERATTLEAAGGTFRVAAGTELTQAGDIAGPGTLSKTDTGTFVLTGDASHAGGTGISAGTFQIGDGGTSGSLLGDVTNDGVLAFNRSDAIAFDGTVSGSGELRQIGSGTTVLGGANSYTGGTLVDDGVLQVSADANLGAATGALTLDGGTLATTADIAMDRTTTLGAGGGTFDTAAATTLTQAGVVAGGGALTKAGDGTLALAGDASHTGGTTIAAGTLQVGSGGTTGSIAGPITNDGTLAFARSNLLTFDNLVSGSGAVTQIGTGTTVLTADNTYSGPTTVTAGALYVDGDQTAATGATTANALSTLGGIGTIGGDVTIADGATLSPGRPGFLPGTLRINGSLALGPGSLLDYSFGRAGVVGGPLNDLTEVGGNLVLDGTLNVTVPPGGSFGPGIYRVISYAGALTDNGLAIGTIPSPDFFVQTSVAQQVNLVNTSGLLLNFWDGDAGPKNNGAPDGGNGTWQNSTGNDNWTDASGLINAPFADGAFAIFTGAPGTVTVDDSLGAVQVSGMQFTPDGYVVEGGPIELVGLPDSTVRVGDGTDASADVTTTIRSALTGAALLRKSDLGTLVLEGANSYAGGTAIDGGVVEIAADSALGATGSGLSLDSGTLRTTADVTMSRQTSLGAGGGTFETAGATTLVQTADVSGSGALTKSGAGTMILTGEAAHTGGTLVAAGELRVGDGGSLGALAGDTEVLGTLAFDRADAQTYAGSISGTGSVRQIGAGTTTLGGSSTYSGSTTVEQGTLAAGRAGAFSAASEHTVISAGTLELADFDQTVARLTNFGRVSLGDVPLTRLTVAGDYVGAGGVLHFTTELGGDDSPTDLMTVEGDTSGTTAVDIENQGGQGVQTVEGIKIIDVEGTSAGQFDLIGDTAIEGRPVVVAGAFAYSLQQNGLVDPTDGDWYLRSAPTGNPGPPIPTPQPGVPVYEAYPFALLALNDLPTMQERIGNRYWSGPGNPPGFTQAAAAGVELPSGGFVEDRRAWARFEASRSNLRPEVNLGTSPDLDLDLWQLQVGIDRPVRETGDGLLIAGLTFNYGSVGTDVSSDLGDGKVDTDGYGLGGTLTWFRGDDVYVDGQLQLTWFDSDLSSRAVADDLESGGDGFGYALGVEAGKRIQLNESWSVTPQGQVAYSAVDFDSFTDPFGARVRLEDATSLPVRLGVAFDQERARTDARRGPARSHLYGIANLYYDLMDGTEVRVGDTSLSSEPDRLWGSLGVGGSYSWNDGAYAVYGEGLVGASLSNPGDNSSSRATVGLRVVW